MRAMLASLAKLLHPPLLPRSLVPARVDDTPSTQTAPPPPDAAPPPPNANATPAPNHDPATAFILMGPCNFTSQTGRECDCWKGESMGSLGPATLEAYCNRCGHPMAFHGDYGSRRTAPIQPQPRRLPPTVTDRDATVRQLVQRILDNQVVHCRGTPTSGKTTLSNLLFNHIQTHLPAMRPVHVTWLKERGPQRRYSEYLHYLTGGQVPEDPQELLQSTDLLLIIDEAQLSYEHDDFWLTLIKPRAVEQDAVGPYIVLFSSYGSADSIALQIEGSAPITLESAQRMSLTMQPGMPTLALCFTRLELDDLCHRLSPVELLPELRDRLFTLTNGHPGLCKGILESLLDLQNVRSLIRQDRVIRLQDADSLLNDEEALFGCVQVRVRRSLPQRSQLSDSAYPDLPQVLREAVINNGLTAARPDDIPGLKYAYRLGFLQAESIEEGLTLYAFPSTLHQQYAARLLLSSTGDDIPFDTPLALVLSALEHFDPSQLEWHVRKAQHSAAGSVQPPEAQYANELYRNLHRVTSGRCVIASEYSYDGSGRVDFFLYGKAWAIEALRQGDRLDDHLNRFNRRATYGRWGVVTDYVVVDFRCTLPPTTQQRDNRHLLVVVYDNKNRSYQVLDSRHSVLVPNRPLFSG